MISRDSNPIPTQNHFPASFTAALGYLSNYCHLHNIIEQGRAALAAALLLPVVNYYNRMVQLPSPQVHRRRHLEKEKPPISLLPGNDIRQFDRLLMMSCHPRGAKSLLNSIFFESDIDCNICGEWIQGTFALIDSDLCTKDQHLLARVLMKRDPKLGFLWLGAFVLGSYKGALQEARRCSWQLDFNAAAWTGTRISFIQEPVLKNFPKSEKSHTPTNAG